MPPPLHLSQHATSSSTPAAAADVLARVMPPAAQHEQAVTDQAIDSHSHAQCCTSDPQSLDPHENFACGSVDACARRRRPCPSHTISPICSTRVVRAQLQGLQP